MPVQDPLQGPPYELSAPEGESFDPSFDPDLTPSQMLSLGVFGGDYFPAAMLGEFPASWLDRAKISDHGKDISLNHFGVDASQSREEWIRKGWITDQDPLGWFQWYCRYYLGRRTPAEDARQIKRWKQMVRHAAQVRSACRAGDATCHTKQRQALLHWAYDSRKL